ncbi:uncharacterized protein LOC111102514 isoform X1 [Crassostrea virginica]
MCTNCHLDSTMHSCRQVTMFVKILLFSNLIVTAGTSMIQDGCACDDEYAPVCGMNGVTYPNYCSLQCKYVPLQCYGECPCSGY